MAIPLYSFMLMAGNDRPPKRTENHSSKETRSPFFNRFVVEPPPTLQGYQFLLVGNGNNQLNKEELEISGEKIQIFKDGQNGKRAWDAPKVNMTSARVVQVFDESGQHDVIQYTTAPSTYFQHRAGVDKETPYETARKLTHSGVMGIAIVDGKIVLSTRPDEVSSYPRTITGTASGSWEGAFETPVPKLEDDSTDYSKLPKLIPPLPQSMENQMMHEFHEETGLPLTYLTSPKTEITKIGIAEDNHKKNWDSLWMIRVDSEVTQESLTKFHQEVKKNNHTDDPSAGHLIFIDANPEEIKTILTRLDTFWDGTADRALLAVGKMLFMERLIGQGATSQEANAKATNWKQEVDAEIQIRRDERNEKVKEFRRPLIEQTKKDAWKTRRSAWLEILKNQPNLKNREPVRRARQKARRAAKKIDEMRATLPHYDPHLKPKDQGIKEVKDALDEYKATQAILSSTV